MKLKHWILLIVLLLIAAAAIYAYREYTRKPLNAGNVEAEYKFTAVDFANEFADEEAGMKKYNGKVIEITGIIYEVSPNGRNFDVVLETDDPMTGINVQMIPEMSEDVKSLQPGTSVKLKGYCTGKLSDIELNRGVIVK